MTSNHEPFIRLIKNFFIKRMKKELKAKESNDWIWKTYQYALTGASLTKIAVMLNATYGEYKRFLDHHPSGRRAYKAAKIAIKPNKDYNLEDFIFGYLPSHLREYWSFLKLNSYHPEEELEIHKLKPDEKKMIFLHAWFKSDFNFSRACRLCGLNHRLVLQWKAEDMHFAELCARIQEVKKDLVESSVLKLIRQGHPYAAVEVNKVLNADRGYNPKVQLDVHGSMDCNVNLVNLEELQLPVDVLRCVLNAIRDKSCLNSCKGGTGAVLPADILQIESKIEEIQE